MMDGRTDCWTEEMKEGRKEARDGIKLPGRKFSPLERYDISWSEIGQDDALKMKFIKMH